MKNKDSLSTFIEERLSWWELSELDDVSVGNIASDLAYRLENNGYCADTYAQALCCPINKRREKDCLIISCPNNEFCRMFRKEGYII